MILLDSCHDLVNISVVASKTLLFVTFKLGGVLFQSTFKFGVCAVGSMLVVISESANVLVVQFVEHLDPALLWMHELCIDLLSHLQKSAFNFFQAGARLVLCKKNFTPDIPISISLA